MDPSSIVQATAPHINAAGGASYFNPVARAAGTQLGLKGFPFYFAGRAGVMGNVDASVVASAFGYFHPGLVQSIWEKITATVEPAVAGRAYLTACADYGRQLLADIDGLDAFNAAAEKIRAATDPAGLTLFAGFDAHPNPDDPAARAYQNVVTLRELRGSVHLVAVVSTGLRAEVAHAIRRPDEVAAFGWDPAPAPTDDDRAWLDLADQRTDELLTPAHATLSDAEAAAYVSGAAAIAEAIEAASN